MYRNIQALENLYLLKSYLASAILHSIGNFSHCCEKNNLKKEGFVLAQFGSTVGKIWHWEQFQLWQEHEAAVHTVSTVEETDKDEVYPMTT